MMNFKYPLILILPLVFLIAFLFSRRRNVISYLPLADISMVANSPLSIKHQFRNLLLGLLLSTGVIALAVAAARPYESEYLYGEQSRRNLMLAIDLSESMEVADFIYQRFPVRRIDAVKQVVQAFINKRTNDRLGLVVFGNKAFIESPLTTDSNFLLALIKELNTGVAGNGTALGDGLSLALKHMRGIKSEASAIILITDGVQTAGNININEAAEIAKKLGIKVYTIAIGSKDFAQRNLAIDEDTLVQVAKSTNGKYYNPKSIEELVAVYQEIDTLEKTEEQEEPIENYKEYFYIPALVGFLALLLYCLLGKSVFSIYPE